MALPARFSLLQSDLNDFLFASVGADENGMPVSVLSALTRLDVDPWEEAARLAALPKARAAAALGQLMARLPLDRLAASERSETAARLIELLPAGHAGVVPGPALFRATPEKRVQVTVWLACLGLVATALYAFF